MEDYVLNRIIYKYRSIEDARKLLESGTLYFNCPSQFNDPFEFSDKLLDISFSQRFSQDHIGGLPQVQSLPRKERRDLKRKKDLSTHMHLSVKHIIKKNRDEFGVFCGSEIYDSTLMWSHYADKHKGICIGFEFPQTKSFLDFMAKENIIPVKVNYLNEIIKAKCEVNGELIPESTMLHLFSTKSKVWNYESEIRLLKFDGYGAVNFPLNWIKEIHFGLLVPDNHIKEIVSIVNVKCDSCLLYDMKFEDNSFRLIRKPYKKRK